MKNQNFTPKHIKIIQVESKPKPVLHIKIGAPVTKKNVPTEPMFKPRISTIRAVSRTLSGHRKTIV